MIVDDRPKVEVKVRPRAPFLILNFGVCFVSVLCIINSCFHDSHGLVVVLTLVGTNLQS